MGNEPGLQRVGKESGHWYQVVADSAFLLESLPRKSKVVTGNKDYTCAACGKPIAKGTEHVAASEDRYCLACPVPPRAPRLQDAIAMTLYPGVTSIRNMRAADELMTYKMSKTARHGIGQAATFYRDSLLRKFGEHTGTIPVELAVKIATSGYAETWDMAEALMVNALDAYKLEGEDITDEGTDLHRAIAQMVEQKALPEDPRWNRACRSLLNWLESDFGVTEPEGRTMTAWAEVPWADPAIGAGGTYDLLVDTPKAIVHVDHKSKMFKDIRARLAKMPSKPPFHVRPFTSDGLQMAHYDRGLRSGTAVIGQATTHAALRAALKTKPLLNFEHYVDRETGETWLFDWRWERLPWQKPTQKIHEGLPYYLYVFDCLRHLWFAENGYTPKTVTGYDILGRPYPAEMAKMAAEEDVKRKEIA